MKISELYAKLSNDLPSELALAGDKNGIMCSPDTGAEVRRALFALDATESVIDAAIAGGFDLVVTHHPLIFSPIASVTPDTPLGRTVVRAIRSGVTVMSFHTIADSADGGVNDIVVERLGITDAVPFAGDHGRLGRVGRLTAPAPLYDFAQKVKTALGTPAVIITDAGRAVHTVAVIGGAGKSCIDEVLEVGADTFVTGELSHAVRAEARALGLNLIEAGHFHTEDPVCDFFASLVKKYAPEVVCEHISSCDTTVV